MGPDLIDELVADLTPSRPVPITYLLGIVALVIAVQSAIAWALGTVRADLAAGAPSDILTWRLLGSAALAAAGAAMALRLRSPTAKPEGWPWAALGLALTILAAGWALDYANPSALPALARIRLSAGLHCVAVVTLCGLPVLGLLVFLLRRGAAVRPEAAATGTGLAAAGSGSFIWALACPIDDPAYAMLWHGVAFALVIGGSRQWLPRLVRLRPRCPTREALRRQLRRS